MKSHATVKLESALEKKQQLMQLCFDYCNAPDDSILLRIGSCLGDFANNLRSALNYTLSEYVDSKLKAVLTQMEYKKIRGHHDFPCYETKQGFEKSEISLVTNKHDKSVYDFLEGVQPYHSGNELLRDLVNISNADKHEVIAEIESGLMNDVVAMRADGAMISKPGFFGPGIDRMMVVSNDEPHVFQLPHYFHPYGGFALEGGKWLFFFVPRNNPPHLGLTRFIEITPLRIMAIIDRLKALT